MHAATERELPPSVTTRRGRSVVGVATGGVVAVVAFAVSVLAGLVSRMVERPGGIPVPWGLAVGVVASAALVVLAGAITRNQAFVAAAGWFVGLLALLAERPEGDFIIAGDGYGWGFMVLAAFAVIVAAAWGSRAS